MRPSARETIEVTVLFGGTYSLPELGAGESVLVKAAVSSYEISWGISLAFLYASSTFSIVSDSSAFGGSVAKISVGTSIETDDTATSSSTMAFVRITAAPKSARYQPPRIKR
jgi:hypothetical protein